MSKETRANARVVVMLEVDGGGPWGHDCTMEQIYRQAAEHAIGTIRRLAEPCQHKDCNCRSMGTKIRIVGEPEVKAIITEEKR